MTRTKVVVVGAFVIATALGVLSLLFESLETRRVEKPSVDLLDVEINNIAGPEAVNCGHVVINGDVHPATDCALTAQAKGKSFRVRYDLQGIDSHVAVAIVRTPAGVVETLDYDSDPAGGGGWANQVVFPRPCPTPVHLWITPAGRLNCFQQKLSTSRDAMSPTIEPY